MFWKIYAWFYLLVGILATITSLDGKNSLVTAVPDIALSFLATIVIFCFAFGKKIGSLTFWKVFAVCFIGYDLVFNLYLDPQTRHISITQSSNLLVLGIGLVLFIPSYIAVVMYSTGKVNKATKSNNASKSAKSPKSPIIAGLMSVLIVGTGHIYLGRWQRGLVWIGSAIVVGIGLRAFQAPLDIVRLLGLMFALTSGADASNIAKTGKPLFG